MPAVSFCYYPTITIWWIKIFISPANTHIKFGERALSHAAVPQRGTHQRCTSELWPTRTAPLSEHSTSISLHRVLSTLRPPGVINTVLPDRGKMVTLITCSSKRRNMLITEDDDEVFTTRSLNVTRKTTEQRLIVRSDKSETKVINNRRVRSKYCTIEANYTASLRQQGFL